MTVNVSMVERIAISWNCLQVEPCAHECMITLTDGRKKMAYKAAEDLITLFKDVHPKKFTGPDKSHFKNVKLKGGLTSEEILTQFFSEKFWVV